MMNKSIISIPLILGLICCCMYMGKAQQITSDSLQILQARQAALEKATELNKLKIELAKKQKQEQEMKDRTDHFNTKANYFLSKAKKYSEELKKHPSDRKAAKKSKKFTRRANHFTRRAQRFAVKYSKLKTMWISFSSK